MSYLLGVSRESIEEFHTISGTPYGNLDDGRLHHYLLLANGNGTEFDVLYDYNTVGTTRLQEGGRFINSYATTSVVNPNTVTLPQAFENRVQVRDGNRIFRRPRIGEVSRSEPKTCHALPTDVDPLWDQVNLPPWCLTTALGTTAAGTEVQYLRVGKPNSLRVRTTAPPGQAAAGGPAVVNGVDQQKLRDCLGTDSTLCLDTVPGLRECVAARKVCNSGPVAPSTARRSATPMKPEQARDRAARLLTADSARSQAPAGHARATTTAQLGAALRAKLPASASADGTPLNVVTAHHAARSLSGGAERTYQGYTAVFDARTSELLYACLGQKCPDN